MRVEIVREGKISRVMIELHPLETIMLVALLLDLKGLVEYLFVLMKLI